MSAIARIWTRWILDETKPHSFEDVPPLWSDQVKELLNEEEKKNEENKLDETI